MVPLSFHYFIAELRHGRDSKAEGSLHSKTPSHILVNSRAAHQSEKSHLDNHVGENKLQLLTLSNLTLERLKRSHGV